MNRFGKRRAFTIVEVLVVVCIAGIVLALTMSVYGHTVRLGQQTTCVSNLRQIALGLNAYYNENRCLPDDTDPARFQTALAPFMKDARIFTCPSDGHAHAASYAPFYVRRREMDGRDFVIGCPRHASGRVATVLYGTASSHGERLGPITHDGVPVKAGDRVTGGILRFADGSLASMEPGLSVDVVSSFQRDDGSYYTVLRVPVGQSGTLGVDANPNSRFEVVTPAAIAGSEGTVFYVQVQSHRDRGNGKNTGNGSGKNKGNSSADVTATVYVVKGRVRLTSRGQVEASRLLQANQTCAVDPVTGEIANSPDSLKSVLQVLRLPCLTGSLLN